MASECHPDDVRARVLRLNSPQQENRSLWEYIKKLLSERRWSLCSKDICSVPSQAQLSSAKFGDIERSQFDDAIRRTRLNCWNTPLPSD